VVAFRWSIPPGLPEVAQTKTDVLTLALLTGRGARVAIDPAGMSRTPKSRNCDNGVAHRQSGAIGTDGHLASLALFEHFIRFFVLGKSPDSDRLGRRKFEIAMKNLSVRDSKPDQQSAANRKVEHDLKARLLSGDAEIIDAIILAGSVEIRAKDLHAIIREREFIEKKFQTISTRYHELRDQIREIMRTLEAAELVNATDPLPRCLAEGTFAAQYLLKEDDLIPDSVPGVGLADDAILVKSIVARHGRKLTRSGWDF
jgi:uncharacterized membrane protein YkvA (DUF1232 family)